MAYGPWHTYGPITESVGRPAWEGVHPLYYRYQFSGRPAPGAFVSMGSAGWTVYQSFAAYNSLQYPDTYSDARDCCQRHAAAADNGTQFDWDPGECATIGTTPAFGAGYPTSDSLRSDYRYSTGFALGTTAAYTRPPLYLIGGSYGTSVYFANSQYLYPTAASLGVDAASLLYRRIPGAALCQIPEFVANVEHQLFDLGDTSWSHAPEMQLIRVDGLFEPNVAKTQTAQTSSFTVNQHYRSGTGTVPMVPYPSLGGVAGSMGSSTGSSMGVTTYADMQEGDSYPWALSSSRVSGNLDPSPSSPYICEGQIAWDCIWTFQIRYWQYKHPPLRWFQRDDGLGVSGVQRQVPGGTSIQSSKRQVSAYR